LVGTERARLTQQLIHECGFAVVYVGDNRNISEFGVHHKNSKIAGSVASARIV
jgi:hypothetical protein